jgi:hypothetical protein
MRIASRERAPERTHNVAGKEWTFKLDKAGLLVCEVDDEAAAAVFLDERNANLFYAPDEVAAPTRPGRGGQKRGDKGEKAGSNPPPPPPSDHAEAARLILANEADVVLGILDQVNDAAVLAELKKQEAERAEGPRAPIVAKLDAKAG